MVQWDIDLLLESLRRDSKFCLSLQSKFFSQIMTPVPLARKCCLNQKCSWPSFWESHITNDKAPDCHWTLLQTGRAADWQKNLPSPPHYPTILPKVYNIHLHLHLLWAEFVYPFRKHKSLLCCRYLFTRLFSLFSGWVEGLMSSWESRYPTSTGFYLGWSAQSVGCCYSSCFDPHAWSTWSTAQLHSLLGGFFFTN